MSSVNRAGSVSEISLRHSFLGVSKTQTSKTGGGVLPYMGYIGMCGPKGYGFSAVLVINKVSNLVDFGHR